MELRWIDRGRKVLRLATLTFTCWQISEGPVSFMASNIDGCVAISELCGADVDDYGPPYITPSMLLLHVLPWLWWWTITHWKGIRCRTHINKDSKVCSFFLDEFLVLQSILTSWNWCCTLVIISSPVNLKVVVSETMAKVQHQIPGGWDGFED